jgi:Prp8 binding protein
MSEKRPAAENYGSVQLVKRQRSDANIGGNRSIAIVDGSVQSGALIQAVCQSCEMRTSAVIKSVYLGFANE